MRSRTALSIAATLLVALLIESSFAEDPVRPPPIKIDRNLRKALLKALADLDTESAEQKSTTESAGTKLDEVDLSGSDETSPATEQQTREPTRTIFSFDDFPREEESPNEDKLQNSTFVETDKFEGSDNPRTITTSEILRSHDASNYSNNRSFQAHDVILKDKSSAIYDKSPEIVYDQLETRSVKTSSAPINVIDNSSGKPSGKYQESLLISSSNGIASANALVPPSPTPSSPTASTPQSSTNSTIKAAVSSSPSGSPVSTKASPKDEQEVKIFQAPLVAAFTVQQDERGVPKSVVPIYRPSGDGQTLTLQEQLDFKQQLLERQLAELQAQQIQQTQFLVRQQQIYEQQLRQKQQQELFFQEQSRLKQLQEEQARFKQLEEQRNYQFQAQKSSELFSQSQQNARLALQPPFKTPNVNIQPSLTLELPKAAAAAPFQPHFPDQQRIQQLRQQQLQQQQTHLQLQRQQQLLQQQRLQQSFPSFTTDFQPPSASPAHRFNRQEAFGAVGNFGFNENRQQHVPSQRNHFGFSPQLSRGPQTFSFNHHQPQQLQQQQFRSQRPQTPAKQIQHLLYQSGVAGNLGTVQGTGGQEDLNIVSKVLALNVGALPNKNSRYNNFGNTA
ncbi:putative uncharacterized protein DDB_G0291608 isoform X2 [Venturia canescens]|uniref:putative uncharacterized protein DDB_G0291608 isoform X2 n=1 Tax=Venturia canescens TaxID=32260 RepID=UPI001C9BE3FB|nr:putative uncharacterized protein DDB_G0291608 isoform X2 [Venturia canescens]